MFELTYAPSQSHTRRPGSSLLDPEMGWTPDSKQPWSQYLLLLAKKKDAAVEDLRPMSAHGSLQVAARVLLGRWLIALGQRIAHHGHTT